MTEYIDKKEAMRRLKAAYDGSVAVHGDKDNLFADGFDYAMDIIGHIKAVDVEHVIRCKDCHYSRELNREDPKEWQFIEGCVWCMNWEYGVFPDDYCSNAKRKENINGNQNH